MLTFQDIITNLQKYWTKKVFTSQPYDMEMGAATLNPFIALKTLEVDHETCFVQGCRRPSDGRYGKNPNRLQALLSVSSLIKPSPQILKSYT